MKVITIVTHEIDNEIKIINPHYTNGEFELQKDNMKIKVFRKKKSSTEIELNDIIDEEGNENILLFHLVDQEFCNWHSFKFDIGTKGAYHVKSEDRIEYERLIGASVNGNYDWGVFNKVWSYFSKKVVQLHLRRIQEKYFNDCIEANRYKELPNDFQTITIINRWTELSNKAFDSQGIDYDDFYNMFEAIVRSRES